jgi:hypothetical protein
MNLLLWEIRVILGDTPEKLNRTMDDNLITAIHNYCDRWCERCPFVERCAVGVQEKKRWSKGQTETDEELWREVHHNFQQALQLLDRMIREAGLDPEEIAKKPLPEPDPTIDALQKRMRAKSSDYFRAVNQFFQRQDSFLTEHRQEYATPVVRDIPIEFEGWNDLGYALEAIRWYAPFIGVKASRAISGIDESDAWEDPSQSDSNGSAKITIIAIERSLLAWQVLRRHWPKLTGELLDLMLSLRELREEMTRLFPKWHKFIRPGFDTERPQFEEIMPN